MPSCITYNVGSEFEFESIVPSTKAGKWRITVYLVGMFDVQYVVPLLLVECMLGF